MNRSLSFGSRVGKVLPRTPGERACDAGCRSGVTKPSGAGRRPPASVKPPGMADVRFTLRKRPNSGCRSTSQKGQSTLPEVTGLSFDQLVGQGQH